MERKRRSVARWGQSTASLRVKYPSGLPEKYNTAEKDVRDFTILCTRYTPLPLLLGERAALTCSNCCPLSFKYAIHGGGFPLRVKGVEPLVGICVVSGLKQEDDHAVICEVLEKLVKEQESKR